MSKPKRFLVVIDPTAKAHPALERAIVLAENSGAALELFICDFDPYLAGERFFDAASLKQARKRLLDGHIAKLNELARAARSNGLEVAIDARWDHPLHEGIVRKSLESAADFVFKDTHYHSAIKRSILSNTDWSLIRECPAPLLLVKPRPLSGEPTVLAAVDPMHDRDKPAELDRRILSAAKDLCAIAGAKLEVVHFFDIAPVYAMSTDSLAYSISMPVDAVTKALRKKHKQALEDLLQDEDVPIENSRVVEGETGRTLVEFSEELKADFLVMGAVSRRALKRLVLGSTAEQVLDRAHCDLLIVKSANFRTSVEPRH